MGWAVAPIISEYKAPGAKIAQMAMVLAWWVLAGKGAYQDWLAMLSLQFHVV
jgi:hypothetical protein